MKLLETVCLLASLPLVTLGGDGLYEAARNRQPVTVTCEEYLRNPPPALWLRISGCDVDYLNMGYQQANGRVVALFFPVRLPAQRSAPAPLVAATRDPEAVAMVQETLTSGQQADSESFLVSMLRVVTKLRVSREIEGYARRGVLDNWRTGATRRGIKVPLAQRFAVVDLHARPSVLLPAVATMGGVLLLGLGLMLRARRPVSTKESRGDAEAPSLADPAPEIRIEAPGEMPAAAFLPPSRRLPGVMLLNLGAFDDASAIEHAPPIGSRAEVTRSIRNALGDVDLDGNRNATARGTGWSLDLDFGSDEPVWTVTATARGDGSLPALQRLARDTGWRLFIPRLGGFVDPADLGQVPRP
ncbi:MAG: hypothetical protein ABJC89_00455 [Acidobacteriota bacterium]